MSDAEQGALADWLAALDDLLTERWHGGGCTLCGAKSLAWAEIRVLTTGHAVAITLCEPCHTGGPQRTALDAVLVRRYAGGSS